MTERRDPTPGEIAIFDRMSNMHVSMPLNGHELGTLHFMTESFPQVGNSLLAEMPTDHPDYARVKRMLESAAAIHDRINIALANLQLAATAMLAQEADAQQNAPTSLANQ